jgi:prepilin-type N-terminal cleavage/methylation domain-containing protein
MRKDSRSRLTRLLGIHRADGFSLLEVIVALAIFGIAIVSLIQLFSSSLRVTKNTDEYSKGLIHARSLLEEAYAVNEPKDFAGEHDLPDDYSGVVAVESLPVEEEENEAGVSVYGITVTVNWPPSGMTALSGVRMIYEIPEFGIGKEE